MSPSTPSPDGSGLKIGVLVTCVAAIALLGLWVVRGMGRPGEAPVVAAQAGADPDGSGSGTVADLPSVAPDRASLEAGPSQAGTPQGEEAHAADAASSALPDAGSIKVTALWRDRSPASGVSLLLQSSDKTRFRQSDRWVTTDADGRASFTGLDPGEYEIEADRGGDLSIELAEGATVSEELVLEGPIDVRGTVIDADGRRVPDAEVVAVTTRRDWRGSRRVATSDSNGGFLIRCISDGHSLGAFASGWAPSKLFDLSNVDASTLGDDRELELELILKKRGGDVWGIVTDPTGAPVPDAVVAVGKSGRWDDYQRPGHYTERPKPHVARADAKGRYRLDGVAPGPQPLEAWHPDWAVWRTEIDVAAGGQMRQDISLSTGVIVSGTVSRTDGEPAAGATVLCLRKPFVDPFPKQGPTDSGTPFSHPRTSSDANGHFELGPLAPGDLHLYASLGAAMFTPYEEREGSYEGTTQETLRGAAGERIEWNPALTLGLTLEGTVTYADKKPMNSVFVTAVNDKGDNFSVATNKQGEFVISGLAKVPHRVSVQMPFGAPDSASIGALYDVVPPASGLEFQSDHVPAPKVEKGTLRFRISDAADISKQLGKAAVIPEVYNVDDPSWRTLEPEESGSYESRHSPGRYRIFLRVKDHIVWCGEPFELPPGEVLDLGTLETRPLCSLHATIVRPAGFTGPVRVRPKYFDAPRTTLDPGENVAKFAIVASGSIEVEAKGEGIATESATFEIVPGTTNTCELQLRAAASVEVECSLQQHQGFRAMTLTVDDAEGKRWLKHWRREAHLYEWPHVRKVNLPTGSYTLRVETSDGQTAKRTLEIESVAEPIPVALKAR